MSATTFMLSPRTWSSNQALDSATSRQRALARPIQDISGSHTFTTVAKTLRFEESERTAKLMATTFAPQLRKLRSASVMCLRLVVSASVGAPGAAARNLTLGAILVVTKSCSSAVTVTSNK